MLKSIHATGIDPVRLAEAMKYAIDNGLPMCIPAYGGPEGALTNPLGDTTFKKFIQWTSVEGMEQLKKDAEEQAARMADFRKQMEEQRKTWEAEHPGEEYPAPPSMFGGAPADPSVPMETVGMARADLDWVANHKQ
jgi:hypothetical protein